MLLQKTKNKITQTSKIIINHKNTEQLNLIPGDILIFENQIEVAKSQEYANSKAFDDFTPTHTGVLVGGERPIAHAVREGYKLPELRLTKIPLIIKLMVFREKNISEKTSEIIKNWALSTRTFSKEDYDKFFPELYWYNRRKKDLDNYFESQKSIPITGPATVFPEPRATVDRFDLTRDPSLSTMGEEGLRRAVKFASRIPITTPNYISKGKRCTPIVIAAIQAGIIEPIVKKNKTKTPFRDYKNKPFLEYADEVLIENWSDTELGAKLLQCINANNFTPMFGKAFTMDQRYVLPSEFYQKLQQDEDIKLITKPSVFNKEIVYCEEELEELDEQTSSLSLE